MPPTLPRPADRPMVVTAWIQEKNLAPFNALRRRFFPPERNYLDVHLTLFHHIPPDIRAAFLAQAKACCTELVETRAEVLPPFHLGRGVAYGIASETLKNLRARLREQFLHSLTPQDAGAWGRPHLTVQNKVTPDASRRLLRQLTARFEPCRVRVQGLSCYTYDGGPWSLITHLPFGKP